jgi:hypothetical protein
VWLKVINIFVVIWCVNNSNAVFFMGNHDHKTETYRVLIVQCSHIDPWVWRHPTLQCLLRAGRHNTSRNLNHWSITTDVKKKRHSKFYLR